LEDALDAKGLLYSYPILLTKEVKSQNYHSIKKIRNYCVFFKMIFLKTVDTRTITKFNPDTLKFCLVVVIELFKEILVVCNNLHTFL